MESVFLFVSLLLISFTPINYGHPTPFGHICHRDENNDIARQLKRFENIPEIGYNSTQFAPMINALYKDGINRQYEIRFHSTKSPKCIVDFFSSVDKMSKIIQINGVYADRKENILTQAVDEARRILSDIQPVYNALKAYELLKNSSDSTVIEKCRGHDPHTTLTRFEDLVLQQPMTLFERIAKGVQYDMVKFYRIAAHLVNRLSVCAVLTKVCDALRREKTPAEQQLYQQNAATSLAFIHDKLKNQVKTLQSEFNEEQIQYDIQNALPIAIERNYGWKQTADIVRERISQKYYHHQWLVMAFESGEENTNLALQISGHNSFFFRLDEYSFIVHAANADGRCSEFAHIFSDGKKLNTLFKHESLFHNILLADDKDLVRCATNLRELLQRYNLPADFFIGVIHYRPNHYISYDLDATSYHVEHLRNPETRKLSKTVIISWC